MMSAGAILLVDAGGTHVRFAQLQGDGSIAAQETWLCSLYNGFEAALDEYLKVMGLAGPLHGLAICAAGPVIDGCVRMTNSTWVIDRTALQKRFGAKFALLVNDFEAVAWSLAQLGARDYQTIGGAVANEMAPRVVLGPGTGLGVAALVPLGAGRYRAIAGEGGHVDLAPANERELAVHFQLQRMQGHVSAESVLSGPGLEALYLALAALDGVSMRVKPLAADIARAAREGRDVLSAEAVRLFCGWLGSYAGNLALIFGAQGGVFVAGGIVPQWGDLFDRAYFRHRFEAKGRMRSYLEPIPCGLLTIKDPASYGLVALLRQSAPT